MSSKYLQLSPQWLWGLVPTIAVSWRPASSTRVVAKDPLYLNCYMSIYVPTTFSIVVARVCGLYRPLLLNFFLYFFFSMVFLRKLFFAQSFKIAFFLLSSSQSYCCCIFFLNFFSPTINYLIFIFFDFSFIICTSYGTWTICEFL